VLWKKVEDLLGYWLSHHLFPSNPFVCLLFYPTYLLHNCWCPLSLLFLLMPLGSLRPRTNYKLPLFSFVFQVSNSDGGRTISYFLLFPFPIRQETKNNLKRTFVCSLVVDGQSRQFRILMTNLQPTVHSFGTPSLFASLLLAIPFSLTSGG